MRGDITVEERSISISDAVLLSVTQRVERDYNALGQFTESSWEDGQRWRISYDERGLVDTVEWLDLQTDMWQVVADYDRSVAGFPRVRTTSFDQNRSFTYDPLGRHLTDTIVANGAEIATRGYTYSDAGNLTEVSGGTSGESAAAFYTYDSQHRLLTANGPNDYSAAFSYSPAGNIVTADVTWMGSPHTRNVRYEYDPMEPQAVKRLVNESDEQTYAEFAYDSAGNQRWRNTPDGETILHWDARGRVRRVESPIGEELYFYDHGGARVLAIEADQGARLWFGESETHFDANGTQTNRYLHLSGLGATLARVEDGTELELQYADALQNLMFSLDTGGSVMSSFFYGAFGEAVAEQGEVNHRRQFNGKEHDTISALRYYGYRYYDPLTLRWISADPLYRFVPDLAYEEPQRMNLYSFSLNNPVRYYDPDGLDGEDKEEDQEDEVINIRCWFARDPGKCYLSTPSEQEIKESIKQFKELDKLVKEAISKCQSQQCIDDIVNQIVMTICSQRQSLTCSGKELEGGGFQYGKDAQSIAMAVYGHYRNAIVKRQTEWNEMDAKQLRHYKDGTIRTRKQRNRDVLRQRLADGKTFDGSIGGIFAGARFTIGVELYNETYSAAMNAAKVVKSLMDIGVGSRSLKGGADGKPHNLGQNTIERAH